MIFKLCITRQNFADKLWHLKLYNKAKFLCQVMIFKVIKHGRFAKQVIIFKVVKHDEEMIHYFVLRKRFCRNSLRRFSWFCVLLKILKFANFCKLFMPNIIQILHENCIRQQTTILKQMKYVIISVKHISVISVKHKCQKNQNE